MDNNLLSTILIAGLVVAISSFILAIFAFVRLVKGFKHTNLHPTAKNTFNCLNCGKEIKL